MKSVQDNSGLKKLLAVSGLYDVFQKVIGGHRARTWIAHELWQLKGGEKVVDLGCGPGSSLDYLPRNIDYCGIDISETYIETARKQYAGRGTFLVGGASDFLSNNDSRLKGADLVLCNGVLHHLCDDEALQLLELSKQIMKPAGRLVCIEVSYLLHQTRLSRWVISKDRGRYIRSESAWKALIEKVFSNYSTNIVTGLIKIPYVHIIIQCYQDSFSGGLGDSGATSDILAPA